VDRYCRHPEWAANVLSDPLGASASTVAGRGSLAVDGDQAIVSGTWAFNSGAHGATWIGGLTEVAGSSGPEGLPVLRFAWVPSERARIIEDWDPSGMRGTGSNSTEITEQSIPTAWTFSPFEKTENDRGPYRCAVGNGNWPIAGSVAACQLGMSRRAIDEAIQLVGTKAPAPDFVPLAQNAAVQRALIRAEGIWSGCIASIERELESMWGEANRNGELSSDQRVRLFTAHAAANEHAVAIINDMCAITGTAATRRAHPLSRCRRDSQALQGHISTSGSAVERAAKIKLGLLDEDILV
jgi:alkylation response protein AidB-like acyl-CoA dehydrogenase